MITTVSQEKGHVFVNSVRIHEPMPLANPFKIDYRLNAADVAVAYKAWLKHRISIGDTLIIAELERIATYHQTGECILIGSILDGEVITQIIEEALNIYG